MISPGAVAAATGQSGGTSASPGSRSKYFSRLIGYGANRATIRELVVDIDFQTTLDQPIDLHCYLHFLQKYGDKSISILPYESTDESLTPITRTDDVPHGDDLITLTVDGIWQDDGGRTPVPEGERVGFYALNSNKDAHFDADDKCVPIEEGNLIHFDGRLPHHTVVNSGHVSLLGPFHFKTMRKVGDFVSGKKSKSEMSSKAAKSSKQTRKGGGGG